MKQSYLLDDSANRIKYMNSVMFSVIIPVYNSERVLDNCIQSILNQSYQNFELLLIDDGSRDNSREICYKYSRLDHRISVIVKENGGVASARNLGVQNAQGKWVVFCDSDDWVNNTWLSNYAAHINDVDLVIQGFRYEYNISYRGSLCDDIKSGFKGTPSRCLDIMFSSGLGGYVWNKCFKLSIIKKHCLFFDERFNFREDEEFLLRYMVHCATITSTDSVGYHYVVPDFDKKYMHERNMYDLYISLYISSTEITIEPSTYRDKLRNDLTSRFMIEFACDVDFRKRRARLLNFRHLLGKRILDLNIFLPTKYLISFDCTGLYSTAVLILQLKLKRIMSKF